MMRIASLLVLFQLTAACTRHPAPAEPVPAPSAALAPPTEAPPPPQRLTPLPDPEPYCIVRNGRLEMVAIEVIPDSTYRGQLIAQAFPTDTTYALNATWYRDSEPIMVAGYRYVKYGLPRILGSTDVVPIAAYHGVTMFAEPGTNPRRPEVVYVPVRPGCEFQPYTGSGVK